MTAAPEPPPAALSARRQQHSLLSRLVALIGLSFFLVELVILGTFTAFYWWALREDRVETLGAYATAVHQPARTALLQAREGGASDSAIDDDLEQALARGARSSAAAPERFVPLGGAPIDVWVLAPEGAYRFSRTGGFEPSEGPPQLPPQAQAFLRGEEQRVPSVTILEAGRVAQIGPLPTGGTAGDESHAFLYLESSLDDIERQVVTYGLIAFGTGALAILFTALVSIGYLRRTLLLPLSRIIRADNAARRGDNDAAMVDEGDIPDDEIGTIMRSRNHVFQTMIRAQEDLDRKNVELAQQREELRVWGRDLERLVQDKTAALLRARDTLYRNEKLAALGRLAANVAHEINNPLASIAGYAEATREDLADQENADPDAVAALRTIEEQAFRCKDILKRLLSLARTEPPRLQPVLLGSLARETVELAEQALERRGVDLRLELPEDGGPEVESDPGSLQQVVLNLIENAADAAATGGASEPWVHITTLDGDGAPDVGLRVEDNGQGVADDVRARVFDPFYTTKPVGRGTGLGLAICHTLLERLGGRIELEPGDPGRGASFVVWLPREGGAASPVRSGIAKRPAGAQLGAHLGALGGGPARVVDGSSVLEAHTRASRRDDEELP